MIAVVTSSSNAGSLTPDQAQALRERFGSQEGLEQHLFLVDRESGEGLAITLFRDREARDKMQQNQAQNLADAEDISGTKAGTIRTYDVL